MTGVAEVARAPNLRGEEASPWSFPNGGEKNPHLKMIGDAQSSGVWVTPPYLQGEGGRICLAPSRGRGEGVGLAGVCKIRTTFLHMQKAMPSRVQLLDTRQTKGRDQENQELYRCCENPQVAQDRGSTGAKQHSRP